MTDAAASTVPTTSATVTTTIAAPPIRVWQVLVDDTPSWWRMPYLGPGEAMHVEAGLGGRVWAALPDGAGEALHGTIRRWEPSRRLVVGGVLVPGGFGGSIDIALRATSFGTEVDITQTAVGVDDDELESRLLLGWSELLARLGALAES